MSDKLGSTRREFLKATGAGALLSSGPYIHAQTNPKLRVLGIASNMQEDIRLRAQQDLGIEIEFSVSAAAQTLQQTLNAPDSFDLIGQTISFTSIFLESGVIQGIDAKRISNWDEVGPLNKTGHILDGSPIGTGDAPHKINFLNPDGSFAGEQTDNLSFVPHVSSVGTFAYNADIISPGVPYETESWSWMLDSRYQGKVGVLNDPSVGIFDLALAAHARGWVQFDDIGAMTRDEVDRLMEILIRLKGEGHFSGFWTAGSSAVDYLLSGRVIIESLYSSSAYSLRDQGINVRLAVPKEGYRGWHGGMFLSALTEGRGKDMAYEYMDWWLSGWAGAFMAGNGYYVSTPQLSRLWMSAAEWDYWYEGKPAAEDIRGFNDRFLIPAGEVRSGGSYQERMGHIAVWNTIMPTYEYILQRWYELLSV